MKTLELATGVFESQFLSQLQPSKDTLLLTFATPPFKEIITQKTKISLLESLCNEFDLLKPSVSFHPQEQKKDVLIFSQDYTTSPENVVPSLRSHCYERSVAYMVRRYRYAKTQKNKQLAQETYERLGKYLGDEKLADIYLHHGGMKKDATDYYNKLQKPLRPTTVDILLTSQEQGNEQILLGERRDFPQGGAIPGGFIDYSRQAPDKPSDVEIARLHGFEKIGIVTALREAVEELFGGEEEISGEEKICTKEKTHKGIRYSVTYKDVTLAIDSREQLNNFKYIEDPQTIRSWSDPRGPVATDVYKVRLVAGSIQPSQEFGNPQRKSLHDITTNDFVMKHHYPLIERVRQGR